MSLEKCHKISLEKYQKMTKNAESCRKVASSKTENIFIYFRRTFFSEEIAQSPDLAARQVIRDLSATLDAHSS